MKIICWSYFLFEGSWKNGLAKVVPSSPKETKQFVFNISTNLHKLINISQRFVV